jgi:hypothetical protein
VEIVNNGAVYLHVARRETVGELDNTYLLFPNLWRLYSELEAVTVQVLLYSPEHGEYADTWSRHWNEGFS